ncbi:MAG: exodeoxyribonuclease V subunit alpha [Oligosphaeraceae bacterium]|nr:exodeoxyribonuclease V subunit alpha [Oligosphaeraceae bacterium]
MPFDLAQFRSSTALPGLSWQFAELLSRHAGGDPHLELLGAMSLAAIMQGHCALNLKKWNDAPEEFGAGKNIPPAPLTLAECEALLARYPGMVAEDTQQRTPLVYDRAQNLLYLHRYRLAEEQIAEAIRQRRGPCPAQPYSPAEITAANRRFAGQDFADDRQQQAVSLALQQNFAVITGGPGTGKTTVLASILALELRRNPELKIAIAAPTGKAASQIRQSIIAELPYLAVTEDQTSRLSSLPADTVHSLLGLHGSSTKAKYHPDNPLPADLIALDEASMLSLELLAQLCQALNPQARLLLLGDKDQLTSVDCGCVFADICKNESMLRDNIVWLRKNYRSQSNPALCDFVSRQIIDRGLDLSSLYQAPEEQRSQFSASARSGNCGSGPVQELTFRQQLLLPLLESMLSDVSGVESSGSTPLERWQKVASVADAYKFSDHFKVLSALHKGFFGTENLNRLISECLGLPLYGRGTPIIVLQNDKLTGLQNGEIGICWDDGRVYFRKAARAGQDGGWEYQPFLPAQLPPHDLVFALTIHKAQGASINNVLMVLPEHDHPVLSRELIYTGITRTVKRFQLWGDEQVLRAALQRPTVRWSGLTALLG